MKYQEFIEIVKNHISQQVSTMHKVSVHPVVKNNGIIYDGLIINDPMLNISPTIYLNPYYHRYLNGVPLADIFADILHTYEEHIPRKDFDVSLFKDYEKAQDRIIMKLVNYERNRELLKEIPHIRFYDLAIIFVCLVSDYLDEYATILIYKQHMEFWDATITELYQLAMKNTPRLLPYTFEHMEKYFQRVTPEFMPIHFETDMYLLTNCVKIHGATCILYPKLLQQLAELLEDNLILLPSSIHEFLILPEKIMKQGYTLQDFKEMICEANETSLTDDEVLSDHAYIYLRHSRTIVYKDK